MTEPEDIKAREAVEKEIEQRKKRLKIAERAGRSVGIVILTWIRGQLLKLRRKEE